MVYRLGRKGDERSPRLSDCWNRRASVRSKASTPSSTSYAGRTPMFESLRRSSLSHTWPRLKQDYRRHSRIAQQKWADFASVQVTWPIGPHSILPLPAPFQARLQGCPASVIICMQNPSSQWNSVQSIVGSTWGIRFNCSRCRVQLLRRLG